MSVSPIAGLSSLSALQQPCTAQATVAQATVPGSAAATTSSQASPTADAAQAWGDAMRAAMGDESSSGTSAAPLSALNGQTATATATSTTPLTPQALAALISGSSTAPTDPLVTSLSAPTGATTPTSDAPAGSFV